MSMSVPCSASTSSIPSNNVLFSEVEAGSGVTENSHRPNPEAVAVFGDSILYVNTEECTSCTACDQPDVCSRWSDLFRRARPRRNVEEVVQLRTHQQGHDHTFFIQHSRDVFAD